MMKNQPLSTTTISEKNYVVLGVSDVHLLHPRTPTHHIVDNFKEYVLNDQALSSVKLMVIVGDFFDRMGMLGNADVQCCLAIIDEILKACAQRGIVLRVLNGTPSHDRDQSVSFQTFYNLGRYPLNFRYVNNIEIEYIKELDLHALYVPDEMHADTADTLKEVDRVFLANQLDQVDYAFMHGVFDFQLPEVSKPHLKHDSAYYLGRVKRHIFIGHDHRHKIQGRIGVQGSFDRCGHGEEEDKGFLRSIVQGEKTTWQFVKNRGALDYKTITCHQPDLEQAIAYILEKTKSLRAGSHVRVMVKKSHALFLSVKVLEEKRPDLNWKIETTEKKKLELKQAAPKASTAQRVAINSSSIETLLRNRFQAKNVGEDTILGVLSKVKELSS